MEDFAKVKVLTKEVINTIAVQGPYDGSLYLSTINRIIRADRKPVAFIKADGSTAYTIEFNEKDPSNDIVKAYEEGQHHEKAIEWILASKGFVINKETGYAEELPAEEPVDAIQSKTLNEENKKEELPADLGQGEDQAPDKEEEPVKTEEIVQSNGEDQSPEKPEEKKEEPVKVESVQNTQNTGKNKHKNK